MDAFVKSFATYRTIKKAYVLSSSLTLDSLERETSTVTIKGTDVGRGNTGDWLIVDGNVYQITVVKPQNDRTLLTLGSPLDAFSRPIELEAQHDGQSIGGFVENGKTDKKALRKTVEAALVKSGQNRLDLGRGAR